jgi:ABC-type Fe3+-citrate transport system substrate-binding protein
VDNKKCKHHDHLSEEYVGAYCNICNLKIKYVNFKVRVVFHNFKAYDGHFIIRLALKVLKTPAQYQFMIGTSNERLSYIQYDNFIFMVVPNISKTL